jgi:uncharacterized protein (TIGR02466 family)
MKVQNLFPTPVGFFELQRALTKSEISFIENLDKVENQKNFRSNETNILNNPALKSLSDFVNESVEQYFYSIYQPSSDIKPFITLSWANYTEMGQSHPPHIHQNSFLSGVFYVSADDLQDEIIFYREPFAYDIPAADYNQYNSTKWMIPVKTGLLLIFPSNLTHSVEVLPANRSRISISFNTFLKGNLGTKNELNYLSL